MSRSDRAVNRAVIGVAILLTGAVAPAAWASRFTIDVTQGGGSVVATGSGSIDLTGLTLFDSGHSIFSFVNPSSGELVVGPSLSLYDAYGGITGPTSFGSGGFRFSSSGTGDIAGPDSNGVMQLLVVPAGYLSGDPLADSATWESATIAGLGLTPGTYTYTWDNAESSLVVKIVPEPTTIALFGCAAIVLGLQRRRRAA